VVIGFGLRCDERSQVGFGRFLRFLGRCVVARHAANESVERDMNRGGCFCQYMQQVVRFADSEFVDGRERPACRRND
jgi:hypothetical protein